MKQPCSLLRRVGAMLYDTLLIIAVLFIVTIPFIALRGGEPVESGSNFPYQITLGVVVFVFFVGFWSRSGRTLGMQSGGVRAETESGQIPSVGQASIRFFASILSWLPLGLGFLWQLWDKEKLTWHDRLSGTRLMHYPKKK
jgi:uncharacterized RDD family membrane protein YckC